MSQDSKAGFVQLRLWPAVILVVVQLVVMYLFRQYGSTNLHSVVGNLATPLLGLISVLLWWLLASRVPARDRLVGLVLLMPAVAAIVLLQKNPYNGGILLSVALPVFSTGVVLCAAASKVAPWQRVRLLLAGFLIVASGFFVAQRVDGVGGDFIPMTSWRWQAANEKQLMTAQADVKDTATLPAAVTAADWPGFRGPARDGHAVGVAFSTDWGTTPPKELWRHAVGAGHSSVSVVGDYAFTQEQVGTNEVISCYAMATGAPVWTSSLPLKHDDPMGGEGPRSTPTYANGKLYAQSAGGLFQCLDASTGAQIWKQEMSTAADPKPPQYGFASSPLVVGDLVLQYSSGAGRHNLSAFNAASGAEVWTAAQGTGGYASPHLATLNGVPQILMVDSMGVQSFEPLTGATIWELVWKQKQFPRCLQPLLTDDGGIAIGANTDYGTRLLRAKKDDAAWDVKEVWTNASHRPYFNDNVGHKGYLYGFDGNRLCCLDLKTGEQKWQGSRYGGQVMVVTDLDLLLVLTERGKVVLVKADPTAFSEVASFDALKGKTWNHPTIANGKLIVRNSDEIACFALPGVK